MWKWGETDFDDDAEAKDSEHKKIGPDFRFEAFAAEFFGTFFLVVTVCISALHDTPLQPLGVGLMLMAMIASTSAVSGGHFNPAVTLGVQLLYPMKVQDACLYVFSQLGGGLVAGHVYLLLGSAVTLGPGQGYSMLQVAGVEVLFSASLVLVVLGVVWTCQKIEPRKENQYGAMAVGLTVAASGFGISAISGCSLNPAVAFGLLVSNWIHAGGSLEHLGCYLLCPLLGALLAAGIFTILHKYDSAKPEPEKEPPPPPPAPKQPTPDPNKPSAENSLFRHPLLHNPDYYEDGDEDTPRTRLKQSRSSQGASTAKERPTASSASSSA